MYKALQPEDIKRMIGVAEDYHVDALLIVGTYTKEKEHSRFYSSLKELGIAYEEEIITDSFFGQVKSVVVQGKRIWFEVAYGGAYLSELIHVACMLGCRRIIQVGSCGALRKDMQTGDLVLTTGSFGNESSTRMYARENDSHRYMANDSLRSRLKENMITERPIHEGLLMTVQAMLAETVEDVDAWSSQGYIGVDMESAITFAVAGHFKVPAAVLLMVADNLVNNRLVTDVDFAESRAFRESVRRDYYLTALRTLLS
jgi:purine-nucleoside phosphorylase